VNCQIADNIADDVGGGICSNAGVIYIDSQTRNNFINNSPSDTFHFYG